MPDFTNPFPGMRPTGDLDVHEIVRALRLDVAAEQDAVNLYSAQADRIAHPKVKNSLLSIADEERVHTGELVRLIEFLNPSESQLLKEGAAEVEEREKIEHQACVDYMVEALWGK